MARASKPKTLEELLSEFDDDVRIKKYEDGIPAIPTGSLAIDVSIGIGGIPRGRVTEFYGPEMGGKTTICLSICKEALKLGLKCLFIDTENSLDYAYFEQALGEEAIDMERLVVVQPESGEDAMMIAEAGIESEYDLIIFDSVAALSPEEELKKDFTKGTMMLTPRLISHFLRRNIYKIRKKNVAFVFTNQIRANIGSYMGGYVTTGGNALKHYTSVRVYISRGKVIEDSDEQIGNFVNFVIKKNKVSKPYRQATTNIILGQGIDYYRDVLGFATLLGVVKNRGSYFGFEGETIGSKPGIANTCDALKEEPELLDKIVKMCYNVAGSSMAIVATDDEPEEEGDGEDKE